MHDRNCNKLALRDPFLHEKKKKKLLQQQGTYHTVPSI